MSYSGLDTLYQNLGPATASMAAGLRDREAMNTQALADQFQQGQVNKQGVDAAQAAQMNPLLVAHQQGANAGQLLTNTGQGLTNEKNTLANQATVATQPGAIAATNSGNKLKLGEDQLKQLDMMSDMAGKFGVHLSQIPDGIGRQQAVQQFMQANQIDPNGQIGTMLLKVPTAQLPQMLQAAQQKIQETSAAYRMKEMERRSAEKIAGGNNAATIKAAQIAADSRTAGKGAGDFWGTFNTKLKTARDKHAALVLEATKLASSNPEEAQKLQVMAEAIRPQAEAEIKSATPGAINAGAASGLPVNPPVNIAPKGNDAPIATQPPSAAVQYLKSNPNAATQFDAKYGAGASKQYLGK